MLYYCRDGMVYPSLTIPYTTAGRVVYGWPYLTVLQSLAPLHPTASPRYGTADRAAVGGPCSLGGRAVPGLRCTAPPTRDATRRRPSYYTPRGRGRGAPPALVTGAMTPRPASSPANMPAICWTHLNLFLRRTILTGQPQAEPSKEGERFLLMCAIKSYFGL